MIAFWIMIVVLGGLGGWRLWVALRASLIPIPAQCAACGYLVKGLESAKCPECAADLSRDGSIAVTRGRRRGDLSRGVSLALGCVLVSVAVSLALYAVFGARLTSSCSVTMSLEEGTRGLLRVEWSVSDPHGTAGLSGMNLRFEPSQGGERTASAGSGEGDLRAGLKSMGLEDTGVLADQIVATVSNARTQSQGRTLSAQSAAGTSGPKVVGVTQTVSRESRLWIPVVGILMLIAGLGLGGWRLVGVAARERELEMAARTPQRTAAPA